MRQQRQTNPVMTPEEVEAFVWRWSMYPPGPDEERVTDPDTGGTKGRKEARLGSIDPEALLTLARVAGYGERKYDRLNYMRGFAWSLSFDALQRHLLEFWSGNTLDPESGLPHLAHAAWHCLALLAFDIHGLGTDDRWLVDEEGDDDQ